MKKIVITGALGYIGMELCKIYSGKSLQNKIVAIDKEFYSQRVNQLNNWNIEYHQIDILDYDLLKEELNDADIIYHLAGITDVGQTKGENDNYKDDLITKTGTVGSQNVIKSANKDSKIVFPSTHVIFEGVEKVEEELDEETKPMPVLAYSKSKTTTENDLIKSKINYVILRLGSLYGYSGDSTRLNIMPNLFAKNTAMNKNIKLFGGGKQLKTLVSVMDVARCLEFVGENQSIENEIFNCANETVTVEEVAKICKNINPKVEISSTDDDVPNLGYSLSNKKIKDKGFSFLYNLENSIEEMYDNWKFPYKENFNEQISTGLDPYIDERGIIENHYFKDPINMIGYVTSKKGSLRGNHYHPIQTQECLLVSGSYISFTKNLEEENSVIESRIVKAGELSIIPPNVAHTMLFTEDSILLNLVTGEREHENYGVTHTHKHDLIDSELAEFVLENYKLNCRACGSNDLELVLSLGLSPLANNLLDKNNHEFSRYPLEIMKCKIEDCFNVQLSIVVPPDEMFKNYLYVSSTAESFRLHFSKLAKKLEKDLKLNKKSVVVDIGSNDGIFLEPLNELGINSLGVEPAINVAKIANEKKLKTYNEYFDTKTAKKIIKEHGKADLVTGFNVFAHSDKLKEIVEDASFLLKDEGTFIFEVQYFLDTMKDLTFDNIYHEHTNYWTLTSLIKFFENLPLKIYKVEKVDTHGGSVRVYCSNNKNKKLNSTVNQIIEEEKEFGILNNQTYIDFAKKVVETKEKSINKINNLKSEEKNIIGYAAPAKATTVLNYFGLNSNDIDFIIEDNPLKHNKYIPGTGIKIMGKESIDTKKIDTVIVMAWNFFDTIVKKNKEEFIESEFIPLK